LTGNFSLNNVSLEEMTKEAALDFPVSGTLSGTVRLTGSVRDPQGDGTFEVLRPASYGEKADRIRMSLRLAPNIVELTGGEVTDGPAAARFSASYRHATGDWKTGDVAFQVQGQNI